MRALIGMGRQVKTRVVQPSVTPILPRACGPRRYPGNSTATGTTITDSASAVTLSSPCTVKLVR